MNRTPLPARAAAQLAAVLDGSLRVGPVLGLPQVLRELGQDPAAIFAAAGVDLHLLDDPENTIAFGTLGRLLDRCVDTTGCACFGLLVGQKARIGSLGLVGLLGQHSPDLGTALHNVVLHLHIHDCGAIPTLSVSGERARFGYAVYQPAVEATTQIYDGAMAIANNILQALVGPSWKPLEVQFAHVKPADVEPYRRVFRTRLSFNAEQTALVFPAAWLSRPVPGAEPATYEALRARVAAVEALGGGDIVVQVRRVVCNLLLSGGGDLDRVSAVFAVHRRTLNRRLQERGASFRQLVDEVRHELARQWLENSDLPVVFISAALGYGDPAAFSRAFRRWRGITPSAWRATRRSPAGPQDPPVLPGPG